MLGPMLVSMHNLTYYQRLLAEARAAIVEGRFSAMLNQRRQMEENDPRNDRMTNVE